MDIICNWFLIIYCYAYGSMHFLHLMTETDIIVDDDKHGDLQLSKVQKIRICGMLPSPQAQGSFQRR